MNSDKNQQCQKTPRELSFDHLREEMLRAREEKQARERASIFAIVDGKLVVTCKRDLMLLNQKSSKNNLKRSSN